MSAKEPAEDGDKGALACGSSFERTITVVKGNSSLGLCSFFPSFHSIFIVPSRLCASATELGGGLYFGAPFV